MQCLASCLETTPFCALMPKAICSARNSSYLPRLGCQDIGVALYLNSRGESVSHKAFGGAFVIPGAAGLRRMERVQVKRAETRRSARTAPALRWSGIMIRRQVIESFLESL